MNVLQREYRNGPPEQLRVLFRLQKANGLRGEITLWPHPLGYEIRLEIDNAFIRSQVTRDPSQIDTTAAEWRDAMIGKDWRVEIIETSETRDR